MGSIKDGSLDEGSLDLIQREGNMAGGSSDRLVAAVADIAVFARMYPHCPTPFRSPPSSLGSLLTSSAYINLIRRSQSW